MCQDFRLSGKEEELKEGKRKKNPQCLFFAPPLPSTPPRSIRKQRQRGKN